MGDDKQYKIQVKGTAYTFRPIPDKDIEMILMISKMSVSEFKILKALTRVLETSAGAEQWDKLTDLLINHDVTIKELTLGIFEKIVKRQRKDSSPAEAASADDDE